MRKILTTVTLFVSFCSGGAYAQNNTTTPPQRESETPNTFGNNQISFDVSGRGLYYREIEGGTIPDTEIGPQAGPAISFGMQRDMGLPGLYFRGEFRETFGTLTHGDSQPQFNGIAATQGNIRDFNFRFGKAFAMGRSAQVVPYFGYGRRSWVRDSSAIQGGIYEQYDHNYFGGGALLQKGQRTVFSTYGFVGKTFGVQLAARAIPADVECFLFVGCFNLNPTGLNFTLGSGPVVMAGAAWDIGVSRHWALHLGTDWNHFSYGQSIQQAGFHEPDSTTDDITAKFGVGYRF